MDELWFKGQRKSIRKKLFKYAIIFLFIGLFIGVGLGMVWRIAQVEPDHHAKIEKMQKTIDYYKQHWTPIREKITLKSKQGAGDKKGK